MICEFFIKLRSVAICPCQGAEDLLNISETELAGKIRSANVYDMQTVTKCIDLLAEILQGSSLAFNRVFMSRINPKLVNEQFSDGSLGALVIS